MTKMMTAAATLLGMGAFAILGTAFQPDPVPLAVTTSADSSIGLPIPAWISNETTTVATDTPPPPHAPYVWTAPYYFFVKVYVGPQPSKRRMVLWRDSALNIEHPFLVNDRWVRDGFATIPVPRGTERIAASWDDGEVVIPPTWVKDLAHDR